MAERYGAELLVTQSVEDGIDRAALERELSEYTEKLAGPNARALVRQGSDPARQMVDIAREEEIDVIVVGSVGMTGRKEFLLENIPNRISHNAPCTVVIVKTQPDDGTR
jgi:nucleotide-binding universal stress UspA family protein